MTEIRTLLIDLPTKVKGFVYMDSSNNPVIVLNSRLPREINQLTYLHELKHIIRGDLTNTAYREYQYE